MKISPLLTVLEQEVSKIKEAMKETAPDIIRKLNKSLTIRQIARRCGRSPAYIQRVLDKTAVCSIETFKILEGLYHGQSE